MNDTSGDELGEELPAASVEDLLNIVVAEDVVGVVRSVNRDGDLVVLAEVGLGEKTLESRRRTADGDSSGAHSTDVGLLGRVDASLLLKLLNSSCCGLLVGAGDNCRPAVGGGTGALKSISGDTNAETSSEGNLDGLNSEGDELAEGAGRGNDSGSDKTSAETNGAGLSGEWNFGWVLLVVTRNIMSVESIGRATSKSSYPM